MFRAPEFTHPMPSLPLPNPEIWGGIECSVNRIEDRYFDQLLKNGHQTRIQDLEKIAQLGIQTIRYPVLWERIAPTDPSQQDWSWTDERLQFLKDIGMNPIVGLLHHGSGPAYCTFDQLHFPEQFARFARNVAERYPWVTLYNPINEPLTTARFAGLYGHWYPHRRDDAGFCRILINQCKGIVLAMQQIRQIQPAAKLVQTEDLGITYSTKELQYQADFDNARRWLGYDLLCGFVDDKHPLWNYLLDSEIPPEELYFFLENTCPPDILGLDYYLTSERYLDHEINKYPSFLVGGNGRHQYVDIEAVRAPVEMAGGEKLLLEAWERYAIPLAVTEVHLGCTREEQMRWFYQAWQTGQRLIAKGVDFRAITAWASLGSFDWNTLLTREVGYYEPGLFDVRSSEPRPTALSFLVKQLLTDQTAVPSVVHEPGWWQRSPDALSHSMTCKPLLIFTNSQAMQVAFATICEERGLANHILSSQLVMDSNQLWELFQLYKPWGVILATEEKSQTHLNLLSSGTNFHLHDISLLVKACQENAIPLLAFSNDFVFDGTKGAPYHEQDPVSPACDSGISKVAAENLILQNLSQALVVRTGALLNPWHAKDFIQLTFEKFTRQESFSIPDHLRFSPSYLPELIHQSLDLFLDQAYGIWHLSNRGEISWAEFTKGIAFQAGFDKKSVDYWYLRQKETFAELTPRSTALTSTKASLMTDIDHALASFWQASSHRYLSV
ncbi:family 1 glycosylhydrolase [Xanthocytophaga flava]|uniref:family 1 glycosylhydrolase n=1 Tax=Xanthocytophaga flava TaxID=3048013 RepID=UPI0028D8CE03|nr:family 1 glycosylhydrolase [Xanthocytophaga flavus]MDJ1469557.1 family 1 glycosylhydrolase [Xanthocytophaga flavus]